MYTISLPSGTLRLGDQVIVQDDRLPEYQIYLVWLRAGNGPIEVADPAEQYPRITATSHSVMLAALDVGLADMIEQSALNSGDPRIRIGFLHANEWASDCPKVQELRAAIGISEQDCYNLFLSAHALLQESSGVGTSAVTSEF